MERSFGSLEERLAELRAVDESGMNALHWAAGQEAVGSVAAARILVDAERKLARRCLPASQARSGGAQAACRTVSSIDGVFGGLISGCWPHHRMRRGDLCGGNGFVLCGRCFNARFGRGRQGNFEC